MGNVGPYRNGSFLFNFSGNNRDWFEMFFLWNGKNIDFFEMGVIFLEQNNNLFIFKELMKRERFEEKNGILFRYFNVGNYLCKVIIC